MDSLAPSRNRRLAEVARTRDRKERVQRAQEQAAAERAGVERDRAQRQAAAALRRRRLL